ncbi:MAG: hypothetical protein HY566_00350 [Candidatus Kerfeldbacteria bacterium]|nr:hypothetical protein [Candidatus Kerfeldbacteria bacterium]
MHGGGTAFLQPAAVVSDFPKETDDYLNEKLLAFWRTRANQREQIRRRLSGAFCATLHEKYGLPMDANRDEIPQEFRETWENELREFYNSPTYGRPALDGDPTPPQLPPFLFVRLLSEDGTSVWTTVDHRHAATLTVPQDPIRVGHDAFYAGLFVDLTQALGVPMVTQEAPNRYSDNSRLEPWYTFRLGTTMFTVGPRKRVISIEARNDAGLDTTEIRSVAQQDKVTYEADGGWQSEKERSRSIVIHAWSREKALQYLTILGREAQRLAPIA